jgi:aminoglycoside phosphotransferase (APT) family kinase protein
VPYSPELIRAIAEGHGIAGDPMPCPDGGMVNDAWEVDGYVIRVVKESLDSACGEETCREAAVVPLAVAAGIKTPPILAACRGSDLTPRAYTVYRRAPGVLLGSLDPDFVRLRPAFVELGRQLALIHRMEVPPECRRLLLPEEPDDPSEGVRAAMEAGVLKPETADEIAGWLGWLESNYRLDCQPVLIHNDVHPWNLMVSDGGELEAILDWGDAGFGDPASDFASMPLDAAPAMLKGYADAGCAAGEDFMARMLRLGLNVMVWELRELETELFTRGWWKLPPGGWSEAKAQVVRCFPAFALPEWR